MLTQKMKIFAKPDPDSENGMSFELVNLRHDFIMGDDVCVGEIEVQFNPPLGLTQEEFIMKAIKTLQDKQSKVMADAHFQFQKLEKKINDLRLLTYQPSEPSEVVSVHEVIDDEIEF